MTSPDEFGKLLRSLVAAFPRWEPRPETFDVFYQVLKDFSPHLVEAAVNDYIGQDTPRPPSAGQLRALALHRQAVERMTPTPEQMAEDRRLQAEAARRKAARASA